MTRKFAPAILAAVVMLAVPRLSTAATIINGGLESGTFAGWTVVDQPGGSGGWYVYTGTTSPQSGFPIAAPPEGTFAAVSDQFGPGSHVLYQDVPLEPGFNHTLSFIIYYENRARVFASPPTLDYAVFPNQQYRVDVVKPSSPVTSVLPGDVLAAVFQTQVGDPFSLAPTAVSFDLSGFAGTTVRIRFAEVDNQLYFNASVDAVVISSRPAVPTTAEQCKNGGWRNFSSFNNQGDCVSFVATNGKNEPGKNLPYAK